MTTTADDLRREAIRTQREEVEDIVDLTGAGGESPQEMHERMISEDANEEALDVLEGLRALQAGELVTWTLHRVAGPFGEPLRTGPSEYVGVLGNSQLTQENIASQWGGGKYRVRGRYASGKIAGGRTITIAADAKRHEVESVNTSAGGFNMQEFLAMMEMREQKRQEAEDRRRADADARQDRLLALIIPAATSLASAIFGRPAAPSTDLPALITALRPTVTPESPLTSMKGMMEMLVMMKDVTSEGGSDTAEIIKAVSGVAGPLMSLAAANKMTAPVPRPRVVRPAPGSPPTENAPAQPVMTVEPRPAERVAPQPLPGDMPSTVHLNPALDPGIDLQAPSILIPAEQRDMFAQLKPQVDVLVEVAANGADPLQVADLFFDQQMLALDDETYNRLSDFLEDAMCLAKIAIFNRDVKTHEAFFVALRNRLVERITAESAAAQPQSGYL